LAVVWKRTGDSGERLRDEYGRRKLIGIERALLQVAVAHLLVAFQHAQVDGHLRRGAIDCAIRIQCNGAGDGRSRADGVIWEIYTGQLFGNAIESG